MSEQRPIPIEMGSHIQILLRHQLNPELSYKPQPMSVDDDVLMIEPSSPPTNGAKGETYAFGARKVRFRGNQEVKEESNTTANRATLSPLEQSDGQSGAKIAQQV